MNSTRSLTCLLSGALVAASLALATPGTAQQGGVLYDEHGVGHDIATLRARFGGSSFRLFGEGDRAVTSLFPTGPMDQFVTNTGIVDAADLAMDGQPSMVINGVDVFQSFDVSPAYAAGREEWVRFLADAPSLLNATGNGFAFSRNFPTLRRREILASDFQFGVLFSGEEATEDGSCLDQTAEALSDIDPGNTLLAMSNCPPTHPQVGGVPTFLGSRKVPLEAYEASQATLGADFNFDWWKADPSLIDPTATFGNFQTYGAYDDYNFNMIGRFGNVVPGGSGAPRDEGWPLGLRTEFDAFTFALPTVAGTQIWRAIIINRTEDVYGVGLDYQKLYVGYSFMAGRGQASNFYSEVWRGAILSSEGNTGGCPGVSPPGVGGHNCSLDVGFQQGATGQIVLKSPIGDLRNILLTCSPTQNATRAMERAISCSTDVFNDASNPHAGDTITYNHFRQCPFGSCTANAWDARRDRRAFGALSSSHLDVLDDRDIGAFGSTFTRYKAFMSPEFPQQPTPYAFWVPGSWDYSANGMTTGGDTLFVGTCYGPPDSVIQGTTRENRTDACVVTWADTMPVGFLGNPAYNNRLGNISHWGVGPFALAAGDTTALVIAWYGAPDSASFEAETNNIIDLYMNFYLSPEAPPKVTIVGVDVLVEDPQLGSGRGEVTLFWDDANDDFVDAFLEAFADNLEAATGGDLARIKALNPDLLQDIRDRARDNLSEILIFKSCDNGTSFTDNFTIGGVISCRAAPARDVSGRILGNSWQAFATLAVDAAGDVANSFRDVLVVPGQSYLYNVSGRTRGATFVIIDSVDTTGDTFFDDIGPDVLELAPQLANPLATSTSEPNVVSVYLPATVQAGSQAARVVVVESLGITTAPVDFRFTSQDPLEARFNAVIANEFEITTITDLEGIIDSTIVVARDIVSADVAGVATPTAIETVLVASGNPNGVQTAGTAASITVSGDTTVSIFDELGLFLFRQDTGEPLFVSIVLDGEQTTPPTFFNRVSADGVTGYPGFVIDVDNTTAGAFDSTFYEASAGGPVVPANVDPTVRWNDQTSLPVQTGGITAFGRYEMPWTGQTFGPGSPFTLDQSQPQNTEDAYQAALNSRAVAQTGVTDAATAALVGVDPDSLVAVKLPFSIRNTLFDRDVEVAMVRRVTNDVLLGDEDTGDTLTVAAPADVWIPGDQLFFLETVELDSIAQPSGGVVLDANGKPIKVQTRVVTFGTAEISCASFPRPSCNPVTGPGTTDNFVTNIPGQNQVVDYIAPLNLDVGVLFDTERGLSGQDAIDAGMDITAQMDSIKVVPNPYIMFSRWQVATSSLNDARLLFSHLPPTGIIRIFTVSGQFVQELSWTPDVLAGNGDLFWDLRTREGTDTAGGLYIFVVTATNPADGSAVKKTGKFVIIR